MINIIYNFIIMNINEIEIIILNNSNNLNNLNNNIIILKKLTNNLKEKYKIIKNKYNFINIIDLNDLCIDKIIYFINNDLKSIINFGNTCKKYKKELFNFIIYSSNSIYIKLHSKNLKNIIINSYYNIVNLKFINKSNLLLPPIKNISSKLIENTINIYNNFYRNSSNNFIIYCYYNNIFKIKYNINTKFYYKNYNELDNIMKSFDYSMIKIIYYDVVNNNIIKKENKDCKIKYVHVNKNIKIFKYNIDLFIIYKLIKLKKYKLLIENIDNIVFNNINFNYLRIFLHNILNIYKNYNDNLLLKTILILIYLKFNVFILKNNNINFNKNYINIIKITKKYIITFYNNTNFELKPKYLYNYINENYKYNLKCISELI